MFSCPNFIKNSLKSRSIAYTQYLLPICAHEIKKSSRALNDRKALGGLKNYWAQ